MSYDATLVCGTTQIRVHKATLSIRSPVFAAMFNNEMQESLSGIVKIEDIDENVLTTMVQYIYRGQLDSHINNKFAGRLLYAADKYDLKDLKSICIYILKSSTTVENVFRLFLLGHFHDNELKAYAKNYFWCFCPTEINELERMEAWNSFNRNHNDLAKELLMPLSTPPDPADVHPRSNPTLRWFGI